jgi:hypothetical protein
MYQMTTVRVAEDSMTNGPVEKMRVLSDDD